MLTNFFHFFILRRMLCRNVFLAIIILQSYSVSSIKVKNARRCAFSTLAVALALNCHPPAINAAILDGHSPVNVISAKPDSLLMKSDLRHLQPEIQLNTFLLGSAELSDERSMQIKKLRLLNISLVASMIAFNCIPMYMNSENDTRRAMVKKIEDENKEITNDEKELNLEILRMKEAKRSDLRFKIWNVAIFLNISSSFINLYISFLKNSGN